MKKCGTCKKLKSLGEFGYSARDGHQAKCKSCNAEYHRRRYHANIERERQRARDRVARDPELHRARALDDYHKNSEIRRSKNREWAKNNPEKVRQKVARRRALKKNNAVGTVSYEAILERDGLTCHICNEQVEPDDVHFDHVIPLSKGGSHSEDNIRVAHSACNLKKGDKLIPTEREISHGEHYVE